MGAWEWFIYPALAIAGVGFGLFIFLVLIGLFFLGLKALLDK